MPSGIPKTFSWALLESSLGAWNPEELTFSAGAWGGGVYVAILPDFIAANMFVLFSYKAEIQKIHEFQQGITKSLAKYYKLC